MNILIISCAYSSNQIELFRNNSIRGYQSAAQNFQLSLFEGFINTPNINLRILSIPALSTFPKGCRLPLIKDSSFIYANTSLGKSFGYINLPIINHIYQLRIDKYIDDWYNNTTGEKYIIVYALLRQQMKYAVAAKKRHQDIKLGLIIPDLPEYMNCNRIYKILGLQRRDIKDIYSLIQSFDCYVVLAEPMVRRLNIIDKPYIVLEGIYNNSYNSATIKRESLQKIILYTGGIQSRYGVFDLIEAFHRIQDHNYRLILCGPCLEIDKLKTYLKNDSRIEYQGILPTRDIVKLQRNATLLVNPRHSTENFTNYSFPSKTLEYMASGTPVLMCPLASMPDEYKNYIYLFNDESINGMRNRIEEICALPESELKALGHKAREFILNNKNPLIQVNKIISLISGTKNNRNNY